MIRRLLLLLVLCAAACVAEHAIVYVYRVADSAEWRHAPLYVDGNTVADLGNGRYAGTRACGRPTPARG
jgi:hypothetical protein